MLKHRQCEIYVRNFSNISYTHYSDYIFLVSSVKRKKNIRIDLHVLGCLEYHLTILENVCRFHYGCCKSRFNSRKYRKTRIYLDLNINNREFEFGRKCRTCGTALSYFSRLT